MVLQDPKTRLGRMKLYASVVVGVATKFGERPSRVLALGYRESFLGFAPGYTPLGDPTGSGDGGHGRGLFQIDDRYHKAFVTSDKFKDPKEQCAFACELLSDNRRYFIGEIPWLLGEELEHCVYAAYNASRDHVLMKYELGEDVDECTTGKDYSKYIFTLADAIESRYPALVSPTKR